MKREWDHLNTFSMRKDDQTVWPAPVASEPDYLCCGAREKALKSHGLPAAGHHDFCLLPCLARPRARHMRDSAGKEAAVPWVASFLLACVGILSVALLAAPDALLGPNAILPLLSHSSNRLGEVGEWSARTVGVLCLTIVLGPYAFGVPAIVTMKQEP